MLVVYFSKPGCPACKFTSPKWEKAAERIRNMGYRTMEVVYQPNDQNIKKWEFYAIFFPCIAIIPPELSEGFYLVPSGFPIYRMSWVHWLPYPDPSDPISEDGIVKFVRENIDYVSQKIV
ncbi:hypothetical protein Gasu2_33790 [Galdieria sulphuraria]|nr:hypothetical protein Gasu2_33790 [Galdieria sulphuraria]